MSGTLPQVTALALVGSLLGACGDHGRGKPPAARGPDAALRPRRAPPPAPPRRAPALREPVTFFEKGQPREVEATWAKAQGLTLVDLSDDWAPIPFTEETPGRGDRRPNSYRRRFIDLANDRVDHRNQPLPPGRQNYLELYGVPPSLSALRRRALADEAAAACFAAVDREALRALDRSVHYVSDSTAAYRLRKDAAMWEGAYRRLLRARGWKDAAEAAAKARGEEQGTLRAWRLTRTRVAALRAAHARLACEGLTRADEPLTPDVVNWLHHRAMVRFERKHMIFGWGQLWGETRDALIRSPRENNHRALLRVLRERLANQLGVIEDGSVPAATAGAAEAGGVDRVGALTQAAAAALGVTTPEGALAFLRDRPPAWFARRRVALRLPAPPAYHQAHMDLRAIIDRGDVWYDFPYDEAGRPVAQPIARRPRLTLYVRHREKLLPLVRWGTTIGGWRTEVHRRCHYWKYKASEVGDRLWKYLVAAPVWMPPPGTPPRDLVARRLVKGQVRLQPKNYEVGPGYLSAYGLVAALHTRERRRRGQLEDEDGGIRTHGSADYMSILTSHSHGCHRLRNHLAVRLISFLLLHRRHQRLGEQPVRWRFGFTYQGKRFDFQREHKGYYYRLEPPVTVTVTRGRILGQAKRQITRYVRKPERPTTPEHCPEQPGHEPAPAAARPSAEAPDAR